MTVTLLVLVLVGVGLLAFPAFADRRVTTRPPAEWARVAAAALIGGSLAIELALVLAAIPTLLDWLRLEGLAAVCHHIAARLAGGGPIIGWSSLVLGGILLRLAIVTLSRSRRNASRARIAPWVGAHQRRGAYELVIVPTPELVAVCVPGRVPQVVVSDGIATRLEERPLEALIAHEVAHLRHRHRRFLLIATVTERMFVWFPFARESARVLRVAVEDWADEVAAAGPAHRREDLCVALRTVAAAGLPDHHLEAEATRRTRRLERNESRSVSSTRTPVAYVPAAAMGLVGVALLLSWLQASHHLVAVFGYCPV